MESKSIIKSIFVIIIIIGIAYFFFGGGTGKVKNLFHSKEDFLPDEIDTFSMEEYENELSKVDSDIEGMSNLDKYNLGLNPVDGSDTDGDGLTDKEEIEIYYSDPTKRSTAGDLYNDAYKVANSMDVNKYYDYKGNIEFVNNKCPEIILTASVEDDLWAVAEPWVINNLKGYKVLGSYNIYNYEGALSIDVSKYLNADTSLKDIVLLKGDWSCTDIDKAAFTKDDNILTLKDEITRNDNISLVVATKNGGLFASFNDSFNDLYSASQGADGLICTWFIYEGLLNTLPDIYYAPCGDPEIDARNKDALLDTARYYLSNMKRPNESSIQIVSREVIERERKKFELAPWTKKIHPKNPSFVPAQYCDLSMMTGINALGKSEDVFNSDKGSLPFANFGSEISPGGNCAGIAYLVSLLHNTGSAPAKGSYGGITWDLTTDLENRTLTDPILNDFKDREWKRLHTDDNGIIKKETLTPGEEEFVKMIGAYWMQTGDKIKAVDYNKIAKVNGQSNFDWQIIEDAMTILDNNRILNFAYAKYTVDENGNIILNNEGLPTFSAHAVNLIRYKRSEYDPNLIIFTVDDPNFPGGVAGFDYADTNLYVRKVISQYDHYESFEISYNPIKGNATQGINTTKSHEYQLSFYDENYNFLNR